MYYCMYFYPNVYSLKLVKHSDFSYILLSDFLLSNATFIKTILHNFGPKETV